MEEDTPKITAAVKATADRIGQRADGETLSNAAERLAGEAGISLDLAYDLLLDELAEREELDYHTPSYTPTSNRMPCGCQIDADCTGIHPGAF